MCSCNFNLDCCRLLNKKIKENLQKNPRNVLRKSFLPRQIWINQANVVYKQKKTLFQALELKITEVNRNERKQMRNESSNIDMRFLENLHQRRGYVNLIKYVACLYCWPLWTHT